MGFEEKSISLKDIVEILFRRKYTLLGVLAVVMSLAAVYAFAMPRTYVASGSVQIKMAEPLLPASQALMPSREDIYGEAQILQSTVIIKDVVQDLEGVDKTKTEAEWNELIAAFKGSLSVAPIEESGFVSIRFVSNDAKYAARAVNTLADVYLEKRGDIHKISGALDFIRTQTNEADDRLRESHEQMKDWQKEKDLYFLDEQKGSLVGVMSSFEVELQSTNVAIAQQEQKIAGLRSALTPEGQGLYLGSQMFYDATVDAIKGRLAELELERNKLLQTFRPDSRRIRSLDQEIAMARKSLIEGKKESADSQLKQAMIDLQGLIAKRNSLAGRIAQAKGQIRTIEQKSYDYRRLNLQVAANEAAYGTYLQKQEEARMSSALDKSQILNVGIAEYAAVPRKPISPKVTIALLIGFAVGTIAAFGSAFGREFFDTALHDPDDVMRELELPTVTSLPELGSRNVPQLYRAGTGG